MGKLVLIDGHSILNRAFYGVPDFIPMRYMGSSILCLRSLRKRSRIIWRWLLI